MTSSSRLTSLVFAAGLGGWIVSAIILWASAGPLGHDEAQYAISASDALAGHEARWFYVSRGMVAVAGPGVLAGGSELALRFVPLLFGIGFVLAAWQVARRVFGDVTAAWVVAVLAGTRSYVRLSSELLSDLPATTCLLAATAVIVGELGRDEGPRWRAMLAAPLLAAALYLRYASCVPIAFLGVAWLVFDWRGIIRRPTPVIATAALFLVLLVPHAITALQTTGSPLGILLESGQVPRDAFPEPGLVTYVTKNPFMYYGLLVPPIMIAGLVVALYRADRRAVFVWVVAVASTVAIALITHAQVRYIFFGTTLLVILGVDVIRRVIVAVARRPRTRRILTALVAVAVAITWLLVAIQQAKVTPGRVRRAAATLAAVRAIRDDRPAGACVVRGDSYTQLEWYTGCVAWDFAGYDPITRGEPLYVVRDRRTKGAPLSPAGTRRTTILAIPGVEVDRIERAR